MLLHVILVLGAGFVSILPDRNLPELTNFRHLSQKLREGWFPDIPELAEFHLTFEDVYTRIGGYSEENDSCFFFLVRNGPNPYLFPKTKPPLTHEQCEVLDLMMRWLTHQQIALRLNRSERWVYYRAAEIKEFFEVDSRMGLLQYTKEIQEILIKRKIGVYKNR